MTSAIVDTLFPQTPDWKGHASFFGIAAETFAPIPWLRVIAGLTAMHFEGRYVRHGDEIRIIVCFKTHPTESYDRDGKLIPQTEPPKTGLHLHRIYSAKDLAECSDPRLPIMNQIRQVAEHEILESLQVLGAAGHREPFWRRELDGLHGDNAAKAELLESRLPADAVMVARQERKAKAAAITGGDDVSHAHPKPIALPSLPSKADRAVALPKLPAFGPSQRARDAFDAFADAISGYDFFRRAQREREQRYYDDLLDAAFYGRGKSQAPDPVASAEVLERRYGVLAKPLDIVEKPTIEETAKILATIVKQRATLPGAERPTIIPVFPDDLFSKVNVSEPGITSTTLADHVRKYHAGNRRRSWEVSTQARAYVPIDDMSTRLP